jgi:hypothetical protein
LKGDFIGMKVKKMIMVGLVGMLLFTMTACFGPSYESVIVEDTAGGWEEKSGEAINQDETKYDRYDKRMSESHSMMVSMILLQNGMDTDLDSYESVYLVKMKTENGEERAMVVADKIKIYPENINQQ